MPTKRHIDTLIHFCSIILLIKSGFRLVVEVHGVSFQLGVCRVDDVQATSAGTPRLLRSHLLQNVSFRTRHKPRHLSRRPYRSGILTDDSVIYAGLPLRRLAQIERVLRTTPWLIGGIFKI